MRLTEFEKNSIIKNFKNYFPTIKIGALVV